MVEGRGRIFHAHFNPSPQGGQPELTFHSNDSVKGQGGSVEWARGKATMGESGVGCTSGPFLRGREHDIHGKDILKAKGECRVKVSTKEQPPREAVLTIELEPAELELYLQRAYHKLVQQANIPGFRKGKAPRRIVEQLYGREYLLQEAMDFMLPEVTNLAVEESAVEIGGIPSVNLDQLDPFGITATVPLTPQVNLGKYLEQQVSKEEPNVTAEDVDAVLEQLRLEVAPWEPVEEPVALGDLLNVSVQGWTDEKQVIDMDRADFIPQEGQRVPAPGFAEAIVGMTTHETKELTFEMPADFEYTELAGKSCRFQVTVHIVKRRQPGALDDEFAKGAGPGYDSLSEMRQKVEEDLLQGRQRTASGRHQEAVLQEVLGGATFELSPLIVDHELEHLLADQQVAMQTGRMTVEQYQRYLSWAGKSADEIREQSRQEAEARIKRVLVLREVANQHSLEVPDEELWEEVEGAATDAGAEEESGRHMFEADDNLDSLRRVLLNRKTLEFLSESMAALEKPAKRQVSRSRKRVTQAKAKQEEKTEQDDKGGE